MRLDSFTDKVSLGSCARNAVGMFKVIEQEMAWRKANGKDEGFGTLRANKPIVALAAEHPLEQKALEADYFRKPFVMLANVLNTRH